MADINKNTGFGATINGLHTYRDFGLVVSNTDVVGTPTVKTNIIDVPGSSVRIDLTETLTGKAEYEGRTLTFTLGKTAKIDAWDTLFRTFLNKFHGSSVKVILDSCPEYYFKGRASVDSFERSRSLGSFTLTVDADPYRYDITTSAEDWLWDSFNFETGIIREYKNISVSSSYTLTVPGSDVPVTPSFTVSGLSGSGYVTCGSTRYTLKNGTNKFSDLVIPTSGATLRFTGTFTLTVNFQGMSL